MTFLTTDKKQALLPCSAPTSEKTFSYTHAVVDPIFLPAKNLFALQMNLAHSNINTQSYKSQQLIKYEKNMYFQVITMSDIFVRIDSY